MNKNFKKIISFLLAFSLTISAVPRDFIKEIQVNAAETIKGDVNGDKKINIVDVIKLKSYLCKNDGTDISEENSDLNGDQTISDIDYKELSGYMISKTIAFGCELQTDSDNDGLCDKYESYIKTDPNKSDTDGDQFTDYQEIFLLNSDPLKADAKLGDEDFDNDCLINSEEIKFGTNLFSADSDNDKLSDYDEVKKYKTNPLNKDTDDDSLPDYFETENGTDPLSEKSDGKTNDHDRIISQKIPDGAFSELNETEKYAYVFSAEINASGYGEENFKVVKSAYNDFLANRYVCGDILDTSYESGIIQDITVGFQVKSNAEDYCIFKYSEEYNTLLPVETKYDGNILSYTDQECGTYCILNVQNWIKIYETSDEPVAALVENDNATIASINNVYDMERSDQGIDIYFFKFFPGSGSTYSPEYIIDKECMNFLELSGDIYTEKKYYKNPAALLSGYITQILKTGENTEKDIRIYGMDESGNLTLNIKNDPEDIKNIPYVSDSSNQTRIINTSINYMDNFELYTDVNYNNIQDKNPVKKLVRKPYSLAGAIWSTPPLKGADYLLDASFSDLITDNSDRKKYVIILDNGALPTCDNAEDAIDELKKSGVDISFFYCPGNANAERYKELATDNQAFIWN